MSALAVTCPHCGESLALDQALAGQDLARLAEILAGFGRHASAMRAYIELFKARPGATLRVATRLKLAEELYRLWMTERFRYNGRDRRASQAQIAAAVAEVLRAKPGPAGFKNHNYLKSVLVSQVSEAEAQAEHDLEAARRAGDHRQAERTAPRPAAGEGDEVPVWERPPEEMATFYVGMAAKPISRGMEVTRRVGEALKARGVDLEKLNQMAGQAATEGRPGELILKHCRAQSAPMDSSPPPVGACLPGMGGA